MKAKPIDFNLTKENVVEEWNGQLEAFIYAGLKEANILVKDEDNKDCYCIYLNCNQFKNAVVDCIKHDMEIVGFWCVDGKFLKCLI